MRPTIIAFLIASLAAIPVATTADPAPQPQSINERMNGDIVPVHDPAIINGGDSFYVFSTSQVREGKGLIHIRSSKDLANWKFVGSVFPQIPEWASRDVPKAEGIWAPDISYVNGQYRLYYAVSTFGSNTSVIGLATNTTLDPAAPGYAWKDEGEVFHSDRWDDFNAIDPNFIADADGGQWLAFGSFWTGIKLIRLDPATGKASTTDKKVYSIAERSQRDNGDAIEAPYILHHGDYYYLFASFDFCCRGANSDYYTVVGRSRDVPGPYIDRDGKKMMNGGGFIVLHSQLDPTKRWRGPGGISILTAQGRDFIAYHAYDAQHDGAPTLRIQQLGWTDNGWPVAL